MRPRRTIVRFTKAYHGYRSGEVAGFFSDATAPAGGITWQLLVERLRVAVLVVDEDRAEEPDKALPEQPGEDALRSRYAELAGKPAAANTKIETLRKRVDELEAAAAES